MGTPQPSTELVLKAAIKHPDKRGVGIFLKELSGMGLATPPGLSGFTGAGRARPSPVLRLFSYLTPKDQITVTIDVRGKTLTHKDKSPTKAGTVNRPSPPARVKDANVEVPLIDLAWGRSGDKGNKANIGIIARKAEYLPFIWAGLTEKFIGEAYAHFMASPAAIEKFLLPGSNAINILIDDVLDGGGPASLRNDAQGKGFAQILLAKTIPVSKDIAENL